MYYEKAKMSMVRLFDFWCFNMALTTYLYEINFHCYVNYVAIYLILCYD